LEQAPTLWNRPDRLLIVGHRGASCSAPENTLASFRQAITEEADAIEFDVQLSADGHPVVIHDWSVRRTTNGRGVVRKLTLKELKQFDAGNGETIPTLHELFDTFGSSILYNLEIKDMSFYGYGLEEAIVSVVRDSRLAQHTLISSFNPLALRRIRSMLPDSVPLAINRSRGVAGQWHHQLAGAKVEHPAHDMVDAKYMRRAARKGLTIHAWTADEPEQAHRLALLGVNGIITNCPGRIRESLDATLK